MLPELLVPAWLKSDRISRSLQHHIGRVVLQRAKYHTSLILEWRHFEGGEGGCGAVYSGHYGREFGGKELPGMPKSLIFSPNVCCQCCLPPPKLESLLQATFSLLLLPVAKSAKKLLNVKYWRSWQQMFKLRPRLRDSGLYRWGHGLVDCFPLSSIAKLICDRL